MSDKKVKPREYIAIIDLTNDGTGYHFTMKVLKNGNWADAGIAGSASSPEEGFVRVTTAYEKMKGRAN